LKRAVREQAEAFNPKVILIEDKASGTPLIQELVNEGVHAIQKCEPSMNKIMRMNSVTGMIESGFVHLPNQSCWRDEYLHELTTFPNGKYDDQTDSTSQPSTGLNMNQPSQSTDYLSFISRRPSE